MNEIVVRDTISVGEIYTILSRRKWQIAITFFAVIATVTAYTLLAPKQYESQMKILVKNERADMIVSAGGGDGSGYHGEVSETEINSEIELLDGINLLQHVVIKCGLEKGDSGVGKIPPQLPIAIERATTRLQHNLTITPVRKANIIQVVYSSRDPRQATAVLRELAESYLEEHLKVHGTPGTYQFFATQAARYQNQLEQAEANLERFRQQNNIVMLAQQKEVMLQKESDSEAALMQADAAEDESAYKIVITSTQLANTPARILTQDRALPNQYSVEHLNSMLADLQNRRTQLLANFRPDDRTVVEVDKEIADTRASLNKATAETASEQSTDVNPVHQSLEIDMAKEQAELAGVKGRRQALISQTKSYREQLMALGNATEEYDDLIRTQKKAEENYLLYAKKAEEARIAESLDRQKIANVAIAEPPTEPHLPSKPKVALNLGLGVLLAGFLSLGIAFGREYLQQANLGAQLNTQAGLTSGYLIGTVEQRSDLEMLTGLPVLAVVTHPGIG
ncbi:MAG TPA: GumC family protein [Bryobacteraceae bacterium]|jgi:uncharacterized protein involved in exopolysaccharide biosynthesis|nr:GumC family protein [Bryobacteraceae bacterium]